MTTHRTRQGRMSSRMVLMSALAPLVAAGVAGCGDIVSLPSSPSPTASAPSVTSFSPISSTPSATPISPTTSSTSTLPVPSIPPTPPAEEWAAICVDSRDPADPADDVRIADEACGDYDDDGDAVTTHGGGGTYFYAWSNTGAAQPVPAVGTSTRSYSHHKHFPAGAYTVNSLPHAGGPSLKQVAADAVKANPAVQRGGFGVTGGQVGGSSGG